MRRLVRILCAAVVLAACAPVPAVPVAGRQTLTLAFADDASRVALLHALTSGKVTSPFLDVRVSFLPIAQIIPAANTKQFDAIEATPLAVPRTAGGEPGFVILSGGLVDLGGTLLVTGKTSAIATPRDLRGKTVAVASLGATFVQEARFVLAKKYGLGVDLRTGEVKFAETPAEAVPQLLRDGKLDAAVTSQLGTYRLKDSPDVRFLADVTREARALTGSPWANSLVVTYRDRLPRKSAALAELARLLGESREYLRRHEQEVLRAVALEKKVDEAFLAWFFTAYELAAGPVTREHAAQIAVTWEAAKALADVSALPKLEDVLFRAP